MTASGHILKLVESLFSTVQNFVVKMENPNSFKFCASLPPSSNFIAQPPSPVHALRRIPQTGKDVFLGQIWKILQNLLLRHTRSKIFQNIIDRDFRNPRIHGLPPLFPGSIVIMSLNCMGHTPFNNNVCS